MGSKVSHGLQESQRALLAAEEIHTVTEELGTHHDCSMLMQWCSSRAEVAAALGCCLDLRHLRGAGWAVPGKTQWQLPMQENEWSSQRLGPWSRQRWGGVPVGLRDPGAANTGHWKKISERRVFLPAGFQEGRTLSGTQNCLLCREQLKADGYMGRHIVM